MPQLRKSLRARCFFVAEMADGHHPGKGAKIKTASTEEAVSLYGAGSGESKGVRPPPGKGAKIKTASTEEAVSLYGAGSGGRTRTLSPGPDFELFASYGIQTNSNPYGGRQRTPKSPQLLIILKLMC